MIATARPGAGGRRRPGTGPRSARASVRGRRRRSGRGPAPTGLRNDPAGSRVAPDGAQVRVEELLRAARSACPRLVAPRYRAGRATAPTGRRSSHDPTRRRAVQVVAGHAARAVRARGSAWPPPRRRRSRARGAQRDERRSRRRGRARRRAVAAGPSSDRPRRARPPPARRPPAAPSAAAGRRPRPARCAAPAPRGPGRRRGGDRDLHLHASTHHHRSPAATSSPGCDGDRDDERSRRGAQTPPSSREIRWAAPSTSTRWSAPCGDDDTERACRRRSAGGRSGPRRSTSTSSA